MTWQGNAARPFCSIACKLIDLGGWLDEAYRLPGPPASFSENPEAPREPSGEDA